MRGHNDRCQEPSMIAQILVVDDDPIQRRLLKNAVERHSHAAHLAENGRAALEFLKRSRSEINVIVLDLMMPEMDGLTFLETIRGMGVETPVIVQTGQGSIESVVQAMRAGAFDFVVKPVSPERIAASISNALKLDQREGRSRAGRRVRSSSVNFADIVSASTEMLRVIDLARRASQSSIPVVLEGESGVGKELIARAIQSGGDRAGKPFITVNCGAIPHNLVESILFGHEKGAFTGATERHTGKFVEADGGTLFLDEIGDLPLEVQVKLLRAVQQGEIETVGAAKVQKVNVRLISATNKDLIEEVRAGRFREDLYYRLNVFPITIPALRRRKEDIPHLARVFAERFSLEQKLPKVLSVGAGALALLTAYDWPGNIRQLENAIFRAVVLAEGDELSEADFPQIAAQVPEFRSAELSATEEIIAPAVRYEPVVTLPLDAAARERGEPPRPDRPDPRALLAAAYPSVENVISSTDQAGEVRKLADVEEELIRFALKFYRGQMSQVARKLGIGRSTLYRKLKDYGIDPDDPLKEAA
ncbi:sigma-54-dependent Fis family transcriptional regulator [Rhizobium sp. LCM 4573]|nr:sigma-54-dependent Fis family transcriptional regulator [Rhizobium sp. LCM 4573]